VPNAEQGETGSISDWLGWVEQVRTDVLSQHRDCIFESPSDGPLLGLHDVRSSVSAVFAIRDTRQRSRRTGLAVPRILPCMGVEVGDRHDAGRPGANRKADMAQGLRRSAHGSRNPQAPPCAATKVPK
jgi:hypothetical protein